MSTMVDYNGLKIASPTPTGDGGIALNNNFKNVLPLSGGTLTVNAGAPINIFFTNASTSGTIVGAMIGITYNQASGTAANTDLLINRTETHVGSGTQLLLDLQVGGTSKFHVTNKGIITNSGSSAGSEIGIHVLNTDATGYSVLRLGVDSISSAGAALHQFNASWGTTGPYLASGTTLSAFESGGLSLHANDSGGNIRFYTGGSSERMRLDSTGKLGIGRTSPSTALDVNGTVTATAFIGSGAGLASLNAGSLTAGTVPVGRLGSNSPSSSLFLRGDNTWQTVVTVAAGSSGQVQFNNSGAFGSDAKLAWDNTHKSFGIGGSAFADAAVPLEVSSPGSGVYGTYIYSTLVNTAASANNRRWGWAVTSDGHLHGQAIDDSFTAGDSWVNVLRSGYTISSVTFSATEVHFVSDAVFINCDTLWTTESLAVRGAALFGAHDGLATYISDGGAGTTLDTGNFVIFKIADPNRQTSIGQTLPSSACDNTGDLIFGAWTGLSWVEIMRLTNVGFLGIGISPPSYTLDIHGTDNVTCNVESNAGLATSFRIANTGVGAWDVSVRGSEITDVGALSIFSEDTENEPLYMYPDGSVAIGNKSLRIYPTRSLSGDGDPSDGVPCIYLDSDSGRLRLAMVPVEGPIS